MHLIYNSIKLSSKNDLRKDTGYPGIYFLYHFCSQTVLQPGSFIFSGFFKADCKQVFLDKLPMNYWNGACNICNVFSVDRAYLRTYHNFESACSSMNRHDWLIKRWLINQSPPRLELSYTWMLNKGATWFHPPRSKSARNRWPRKIEARPVNKEQKEIGVVAFTCGEIIKRLVKRARTLICVDPRVH